MPGKPIKIGPFTGGLNNISTAGESQDNELIELVNFEVAKDESLTSRPPITVVPGTSKIYSENNFTGEHDWEVLGIYRVTSTQWYLITWSPKPNSQVNDVFSVQAHLNGNVGAPGAAPIEIKPVTGLHNKITGMVQFKDELFFIVGPEATSKSFSWKIGGTPTERNLPKGNLLISWKTRLWVSGTLGGSNADRIWFSYVGPEGPDPGRWDATDFFDVAPGEGGFITCLIPSYSNLIVFKNDGTWRFSYPSSPKQGMVDKISGSVGASGKNAAVEFENFIYVYDQGYVYELVNSNLSQLNPFVSFKEDPKAIDGFAPDVELSIVNRRLVVRYFNALYVFNVATKAWSTWRSYAGIPGRFQELPVNSARSDPAVYIAPSRGRDQNFIINFLKHPDVIEGRNVVAPQGEYLFLTEDEKDTFDIPVSPNQRFRITYKAVQIAEGSQFRVRFLHFDGTISELLYGVSSLSEQIRSVAVPETAMLAQVSLWAGTAAFSAVSKVLFGREAITSPTSLLKFTDSYSSTLPAEYIECEVLTKTYDYQAATSFKRLFYWGADLLTPRAIHAEARPVGKKNSVTWDELGAYTWAELSKGTWANPLSWKNRSTAVVSMTSENVDVSENGRFYVKLKKNLRFRQIAFYLRLTTLGNKATGPAKVFALTTLVNPKKDTIDTAT